MKDKLIIGAGLLLVISLMVIKTGIYKNSLFRFGLVWFLVWLFPTLVPINNASLSLYFLEHRLYLPVVGLVICGLVMIKKVNRILLGMVGISLMVVTAVQVKTYRDPVSFWLHTATCSPHAAMAWANLGATYYSEGLGLDKAEKALQRAIAINPHKEFAHGNLASVYFDQGKYAEALLEITRELEITGSADNYFMAGAINERLGNLDGAVKHWNKTLNLEPKNWRANMALVQYYYYTGNIESATPYYLTAKAQDIVFSEEIEKAMSNRR